MQLAADIDAPLDQGLSVYHTFNQEVFEFFHVIRQTSLRSH
jgi:hypothetical protein